MSLDVSLKQEVVIKCPHCNKILETEEQEVYTANITHNLGNMAEQAGIYDAVWRPYRLKSEYKPTDNYDEEMKFEESQVIKASEIISILTKGLAKLKAKPEYYKRFDSENGWGIYKHFVLFVEKYLEACKEYPEAFIKTDR